MNNIKISSKGIEKALRKFDYLQAIAEYIWNGFDAEATVVDITLHKNILDGVEQIVIADNGYGIKLQEVEAKFTPFYESEKSVDPDKRVRTTSAMHGKNGIGRLTFHHFASEAIWQTTYEDGLLLKNTYDIHIHARSLDKYQVTKPTLTDRDRGTLVTFNHVIKEFVLEDCLAFLSREFGWFLELHADKPYVIRIDGEPLDYASLIAEKESFMSVHPVSQTKFNITYIRWADRINHEYSKLYFIDSKQVEKHKQPTTFNNKGDAFYHSVYIQSRLFDQFDFSNEDVSGQQAFTFGSSRKSDAFQFLLEELGSFITDKRQPYLRKLSDAVIKDFAESKAFPTFAGDPEATAHKDELEAAIRELCHAEPRVFARLNPEQKKVLAHLIHLVGSGDRQRLLEAL
ncbi:ATP-binding protein [Paenibacillus pectinilyticus]|nr:ATP-binding protein [Paenibacillus pectinilyticus]